MQLLGLQSQLTRQLVLLEWSPAGGGTAMPSAAATRLELNKKKGVLLEKV